MPSTAAPAAQPPNSRHMATEADVLAPSAARTRFETHFKSAPVEDYDKQWDALWQDDFLPWDKMCASPALVDLMNDKEKRKAFAGHEEKRALVPGCGRGYDVHVFAQHGYDTVGVEISEAAAQQAKKWIAGQVAEEEKEGNKIGKMEIVLGDFFSDEWLQSLHLPTRGAFELVYDYAFLVAMDPSSRKKWARRMSELTKPGVGCLICLEWPRFRAPETGGPPHGITSDDYDSLLSADFEKLQHYKPERTHGVGKDSDMVSVWRRRRE
ncbi:thiopurine S-methyltransferase family protein [Saccharata proteae CBS 121410]|uniref:Thiopurine S-methyltransferase family protein n=1 Tax=Saccharata proteae CBS 121410 TaxID=1314787 RepID=A0A9P4HPA6_9PEZI|nr:thiopurine S-methyltransferase family protein [Saccharata proteae CBS 121410]